MDMISKNLTEETRTIVVVGGRLEFEYITTELEENGFVFAKAWEGMTQRNRDILATKFLTLHLLITTPIWHRDILPEYFDTQVYSIINYDCCSSEDYMVQVGWFTKVDKAITVVDLSNLCTLLAMQKSYDLKFKRLVPSKFAEGVCRTKIFEKQKHYATMVDPNISKDDEQRISYFDDVWVGAAGGTKSIIFVEDANAGKEFVEQMSKIFTNMPAFTSSISDVAMKMDTSQALVRVTTSDAINNASDEFMNMIKENMHVVINCNMPAHMKDYHSRFRLCKTDGVVVHLVTYTDCLNLFDIQSNIGVDIEDFEYCNVLEYLENTYPGTHVL